MAKRAASTERTYTYRNGKKIYLDKAPDQFVVRTSPEELDRRGIHNTERVSLHSTRVTVPAEELDAVMEEMRTENVTHHAYTEEDSDQEFLITDRIMVTFKSPLLPEVLNQFLAKYALIILESYSETEYLFQLTDQTNMNPVKLVVLINETERDVIESCEHDLNMRMKRSNINVPADAKFTQQWHLHKRLNNPSVDFRSSSNCEEAWNLLNHFGSVDVVVAVSDDGCKIDHADFDSLNKFAEWGYMQNNTLVTRSSVGANPQLMYQANADHGTNCCGVVAAEVDGVLTVGAAPGARLLPIKWQSDDNGLYITDGRMMTVLLFIAEKADVMSNSWGNSPKSNFNSTVVNKITQLAQNGGRRGKGIVFLFAAGNENCPVVHSGTQNIPYDRGRDQFGNWVGVSTAKVFEHNLAGIPGVMYIAALASNAQRSHYSNYGQGIALSAPTNNVHLYRPIIVTGLGVMTTSGVGQMFNPGFGGTSSATPLTAGIAALVISANPGLTAMEVISILQRTASKDLSMTAYAKSLATSYDPNPTWDISPVAPHNSGNFKNISHADGTWSGWYGFGKVDAAAAVAEALRMAGGIPVGNNIITQSSTPAKAIPDNNPTGIADIINIPNGGTISSVSIDLDLTHTYIGDLVIKLISPRGTPAILHDRNGGSAKNIIKTFDAQTTPTITRFNGEPASGNWTIEVVDTANIDSGTLNKWTLHIGVGVNQEIEMNEAPGITIPDNNPAGIERVLNTASTGNIKEVAVEIDITHTYISDLIVNLVSPQRSVISLHSKTGGDADNLIKTFNFTNHVDLRSLLGQTIQGNWKLKVSDVAGQDVGKLNRWKVTIKKQ